MDITPFYDTRTHTLTYLIWDPGSKDALVIDSVLDFDPETTTLWFASVDRVDGMIRDKKLTLRCILETHAHADHLSGAQELKRRHPSARIGISDKIGQVQEVFKPVFGLDESFQTDGSQFDMLLSDSQIFSAGSIEIKAISTPGHTPACMSYKIDDAVFTGDSIFLPDSGTGRCDFPAGSAHALYHSVHERLYSLPDETRVFVGHDYQPDSRELQYESTIGAEKAANVQIKERIGEAEFVEMRNKRDSGLAAPRLLYQSIQVNIDAGRLPKGSSGDQAVFREAKR